MFAEHNEPVDDSSRQRSDAQIALINERLAVVELARTSITLNEHHLGETFLTAPTADQYQAQPQSIWLGVKKMQDQALGFAFSVNDSEIVKSTLRNATVDSPGKGFFINNTLYLRVEALTDSTVQVALYQLQERTTSNQLPIENDQAVVRSIAEYQNQVASDKYETQEFLPFPNPENERTEDSITLELKTGDLGGIGPFDDLLYSDEEVLNFIYSTRNTLPEEDRHRYAIELKEWQEMRRKLQAAEVIFIPMINGIGDRLYHAGVATELARRFPDKIVIFQNPDLEPYEPEVFAPNLRLVGVGRTDEGQAIKGFSTPEILELVNQRPTFVINLSAHTSGAQFVINPNQINQIGLDRNQFPSEVTLFDHPSRRDTETGELIHTLWNDWGNTMIPPSSPRAYEIHSTFPGLSIARIFVAHQVDDYASKLHVLADIPIPPEFPTFPIRELPIPSEASYDYFFVYDAESQGRVGKTVLAADIKVIGEKTLANTFTEILARNPEARIAVVKGHTHPEIAEALQVQFPQITVVETSFQGVLTEGLKSDVIVTSDTGLGHFFEAHLLPSYQPNYQGRQPKHLSCFAVNSPYPVSVFGLRYATTVLVEKDLYDVPANVILDPLEK